MFGAAMASRLVPCTRNPRKKRHGSELVHAGLEQPDHQLGGAVHGALGHGAFADVLGGSEWRFKREILAAKDPELADRLPLGDRRRYRPSIDDAGQQTVVGIARHHQRDEAGGDEMHVARIAAEHLGFADVLAFRKQHAGLEAMEAPVEHLLSFIGALLFGFCAVTTTMRCRLSCVAVPTRLKPASTVSPVFMPSAPMPMPSSGLRFCWRMLFQVNSRSAKYGKKSG